MLHTNFPPSRPVRRALCTYFSSDRDSLLREVQAAYAACRSRSSSAESDLGKLLAIVVPHGAACDGFVVAAAAYQHLNAFLQHRRCTHLTAVLLGTEHRGSTPVCTSRLDWSTPLGTAHVDTSAVDYLSQQPFNIPVNEAPHASEHSIENQLPFLLHACGAACGWNLGAAGGGGGERACGDKPAQQPSPTAAAAAGQTAAGSVVGGLSQAVQGSQQPAAAAASLSIVPVSVGYLGSQLHMIKHVGTAIRELIQHIHQQQQQQQQRAGSHAASRSGSGSSGGSEVVLVVTSDFTHAGPWYGELPPAGVSLEGYMASQDTPVLQAVQQGSVDALLSAAAKTRNSMCGLYPLAVALEALYGNSSSSSTMCAGSSGVVATATPAGTAAAAKPELLDYRAAHTIFNRPDSTGFAAFAVYAAQ